MIAVEAELNRQGRLQIESKQDLRRRGLPSPDFLESLTLTVAQGINNEGLVTGAFIDALNEEHGVIGQ